MRENYSVNDKRYQYQIFNEIRFAICENYFSGNFRYEPGLSGINQFHYSRYNYVKYLNNFSLEYVI